MKEKLNKKITTQIDAIKHFIEQMDIEMIDSILDNNLKYQKFEKSVFISKLSNVFNSFIELGDSYLLSFECICNSCDKSKTGYTFVGNLSKNYLSIIFDSKDQKITDLYECNYFINKTIDLNLGDQIFIDDEFPPF
jgi:hypothetical protein